MKTAFIRALSARNRWSGLPVVHLQIEFDDEIDAGNAAWDNCLAELSALLPELPDLWRQKCNEQKLAMGNGRLRLGLLIATVALALERQLGLPHDFATVRAVRRSATAVNLAFGYCDPWVGHNAAELAAKLVRHSAEGSGLLPRGPGDESDPGRYIAPFFEGARQRLPGPALVALLAAAGARDIPVTRVPTERPFFVLGHGRRQRRLLGLLPDGAGDLACRRARDAGFVQRQLQLQQFPAVRQRQVVARAEALETAKTFGYPLVVKAGPRGSVVALGIADESALLQTLDNARPLGPPFVVEAQAPGDDHRLLVIGGRLVAVLRRDPQGRGDEDVTDEIHPDNRRLAELVARSLLLDNAGIDVLSRDIGRSYRETGAVIRKVTPEPDLERHRRANPERDVIGPLLERLFPPGDDGRIPIAAVTGTTGKTTTCLMVERIFALKGIKVGSATTSGVRIDGFWQNPGDWAGASGHVIVLEAPEVELAVLESARGGLLKRGLAFDRCTVGAVTSVTEDHLGLDEIETLEEMVEIKSLVARHASELLVLNAEDAHCLDIAAVSAAKRLCYVSLDPDNVVFRNHVGDGGPAVGLSDGESGPALVLHRDGRSEFIIAVDRIPATHGGLARFNVQNAAFAAAIALGLGASPDEIARGLANFASSVDDDPGRLNFFEGFPFKVLVDFAHNRDGVEKLCAFIRNLPKAGTWTCVFTASGFRKRADLEHFSATLAPHFDRFVCYETERLYETKPGEVRQILCEGLIAAGVGPERIALGEGRRETVAAAFRAAQPGDFLVILPQWASAVLETCREVERLERTSGRGAAQARTRSDLR